MLIACGCGRAELTDQIRTDPADDEQVANPDPPAAIECGAAEGFQPPKLLVNAERAWLGRCGHVAYVTGDEPAQLWLMDPDQQSEQLISEAVGAGPVMFSHAGDRLYYGELKERPGVHARTLATGEETILEDAALRRVMWCQDADAVVVSVGGGLGIFDAALKQGATLDGVNGDLPDSGPNDCKLLLSQATALQVVKLDGPAPAAVELPMHPQGDTSLETFTSLPYQPFVLQQFEDLSPCGDTNCVTFAETVLWQLEQTPQALFRSGEGVTTANPPVLLLSDPPGAGAIVLTEDGYRILYDGTEHSVELSPFKLLQDQQTFVSWIGAETEAGMLVLVREGDVETLGETTGEWRFSEDESRVMAVGHAIDLPGTHWPLWSRTLTQTSSPEVLRDVPTGTDIKWVSSDGLASLRVHQDVDDPDESLTDMFTAGEYLVGPDGEVRRRWEREAVVVTQEAHGHFFVVSDSGSCPGEDCGDPAAAGVEVYSSLGDNEPKAHLPIDGIIYTKITLDATQTRYLISHLDQHWVGQLGD